MRKKWERGKNSNLGCSLLVFGFLVGLVGLFFYLWDLLDLGKAPFQSVVVGFFFFVVFAIVVILYEMTLD